jgi:hypothetical protein
MPRWRHVAWLLPLALLAAACGSGWETPGAPSTAMSSGDAIAPPFPTPTFPTTSATATATPAAPTPVPPQYLGRCVRTVCELLSPAESRTRQESPYSDFSGEPGSFAGVLSPDGTKVAKIRVVGWPEFVSGEGRLPADLVVETTDGSTSRTLLRGGYAGPSEKLWIDHSFASWSPHSREILFYRGGTDGAGESIRGGLFIVGIDGLNLREVPLPGAANAAWLPSGQVAFRLATSPRDKNGGQDLELFVANLDGSGLRRLTNGGAFAAVVGPRPLAVSGDGRCIAYMTDRNGPLDIYAVCLDRHEYRVTLQQRPGDYPSGYAWLTDGRVAVPGARDCPGLLAVRIETDERDCIVY